MDWVPSHRIPTETYFSLFKLYVRVGRHGIKIHEHIFPFYYRNFYDERSVRCEIVGWTVGLDIHKILWECFSRESK